jgi:malate dehydrogenase (oxaloacetate-decarboxylating)
MGYTPTPGYSIVVRLEIENKPGMFAKIAGIIGEKGGDLRSIDIIKMEKGKIIRDVSINTINEEHGKDIVKALQNLKGVKVLKVVDQTFLMHEGGKIGIYNKREIKGVEDLARVYTPGVARVCMDIYRNPDHIYRYTIKGNTVAVITDGTAVLGLGNIGPAASMPVMEGKCVLFKEFAGIDAFPLAISTTDVEEFVSIVKKIAVPFGGINLEDISAPRCFEIEKRLREELDIPVVHDDQHGTAIVVLAALINVGRLLKEDITRFKVVVSGAGASGTAVTKLLLAYGIKNVIVCDRKGAIYEGREGLNPYKEALAKETNPFKEKGSLKEVLKGAKVFIGLSAPNLLTREDIKNMAKEPVVFALANPDPEISPEEITDIAKVIATGRSDYPNQINNALAFPGLFRGLLDARAKGVTPEVFIEAAKAIASIIKDEELNEDYIIPSIFNPNVTKATAKAVAKKIEELGLN